MQANQRRSRRRFLAGLGGAALAGVAGCLSGGSDESSASPTGADGPNATESGASGGTAGASESAEAPPSDPSEFERLTVEGVEVPLVPVVRAREWHRDGSAGFVDARSRTAYEEARVAGAALSSAPHGMAGGDPTDEWSPSTRVVTYCACPHHLSSLRAAWLMKEDGFDEVYAIDEGFVAWRNLGYPVEGSNADLPAPRTIRGRTDPASAGETAWARHEATGQMEAGPIAADGSFSLALRFYDVTDDSPIVVETPDFRIERPLGELAGSVLRR